MKTGALFEIKSEEFEKLIGKKGDILDSLQYLASLVCNRIDREEFQNIHSIAMVSGQEERPSLKSLQER